MNKMYFNWTDIDDIIYKLIKQIEESKFIPNYIIAPSRGGLIPGVILSHYFDIPFHPIQLSLRDDSIEDKESIYKALNVAFKNILFVDDINDTGRTILRFISIKNQKMFYSNDFDCSNSIKYLTLFERKTSLVKVDYTSSIDIKDDWIVFPWETSDDFSE